MFPRMKKKPEYLVRRAELPPRLDGKWNEAGWRTATTACVSNFHPAGSGHRPKTEFKVLYDDSGLYVSFRVRDRFVRAISRKYLDMVCRDSCVEFFVQPERTKGYLNFEINCGGVALIYYIEDPERTPGGFRKFKPVSPKHFKTMRIFHSMPARITREITRPITWHVSYFVPFSLIEHYVGKLGGIAGQVWRGNFYKCADETSRPHWASWSPIRKLNFHQPGAFARIRFES
ncbi:MAG: hypothetical protein C0404_00070 [Verrucomicrobia bacterium]|nr:hypothetical protein [Verrucomicrobiota bacterium]